VDGLLSKILSLEGYSADEDKDTYLKIFKTIDTDGTGSCSIDELTVIRRCSVQLEPPNPQLETLNPQPYLPTAPRPAGLPQEALLQPRRDRRVHPLS
jgi:hypothetical protein